MKPTQPNAKGPHAAAVSSVTVISNSESIANVLNLSWMSVLPDPIATRLTPEEKYLIIKVKKKSNSTLIPCFYHSEDSKGWQGFP